jgi:surface protein
MSALRNLVRTRRRLAALVAAAFVLAGFAGVPLARGAFSSATANLANNAGAAGSFTPMVITVDTTKAGANPRQVTLPLRGNVNVGIDWGGATDNCPTTLVAANRTTDTACTYTADGTYTIKLYGTLAQFGTGGSASYTPANAPRITGVTAWGGLGLQSLAGAFTGATNLTTVPADLPTTVTDLSNTFNGATAFNDPNIVTWNTAAVTNTASMFRSATAFNQPIGTWNTSAVNNMMIMFFGATSFNQNISSWNTSAVTNMSYLFQQATAFNQNISSWNTANVTDMAQMFFTASAFNQNLTGWCVTNIATTPSFFDTTTTAWTATNWRPQWGTCPTTPAQTTAVTATPGNAQIAVSWTAPSNGGAVITGYDIRWSTAADMTGATTITNATTGTVTGNTYNPAGTAYTLTGLTGGTTYYLQVRASNAKGTATAWGPTTPIAATAFTVPGTPTNVAAAGSNGQVDVSWDPPASTGGSTITAYTATLSPGGAQCTVATPTATTRPAVGAITTRTETDNGAWNTRGHGRYGYVLAGYDDGNNDRAVLPAGISYANSGTAFTWNGSTALTPALQDPANTNRRATTWFSSGSMTQTFTFADAATRTMRLYALDWDNTARRQTVAVTVGGTTQTATLSSSFNGGIWLDVPVNVAAGGTVTITTTLTAGTNAVLSGVFFDPPATNTCSITGLTAGTPYTASVVATNATGAGAAGTSNGGWSPATVSPTVWFDANDAATLTTASGTVSAWADKSGNANNATQATGANQPTLTANSIGGRPAVVFNTANAQLPFNGTSIVNSNYTVAALVDRTASSTWNFYLCGSSTPSNTNLTVGWRSNTVLTHAQWGNDYDMTVAGYTTPIDQVQVFTHNATSGKATWVQGTQAGTSANTTALSSWTGSAIGRCTATSSPFSGKVGEIVIAPTTLSATDRQTIEGHLAWKWGTQAALPAGHPYLTAPPGPAPITTPGAPTITSATAGSSQATVTWTAPTSTGGSPITRYYVRTFSNAALTTQVGTPVWTTAGGTTTATVTGLANSTYWFTVTAVTTAGAGTASASATATPYVVPGAPTATAASRLHVTTLAGSGSAGSTDATGTAASFNQPIGTAFDTAGNLYVADYGNHTIRKITPAGAVTTFAGSGTAGATDATGTAASFNGPTGLAFDAAGNLYVGDYGNHKIRKVTPAGVVTTFAGSGTAGATDATGTAASFNQPIGTTFDTAGNLYVADAGNHKIRKITPAGSVTTFAGSGTPGATDATGTAASFNRPTGSAFDSAGNLYVSDFGNHKIRKIIPAGVVTTFAGSGTPGATDATGTAASFNGPLAGAFDVAGNLYIADRDNHKIRKITPAGVVSTFAGSGTAGSAVGAATGSAMHAPRTVIFDATGVLHITEINGNRITKVVPAGSGSLAVGWTAPASTGGAAITDYLVEYRTSPSGTWTTFADGGSTTTSTTITGLTDGTTYDIRISASNAAGTGTPSATVTATPGTTPSAPTALTLTPAAGQLTATWTAPTTTGGSPITDYAIEYRTSPSGTWTVFPDGTSTATSAAITGLTDGTAYDVRVSGANSLGAGTASAAATATPYVVPGAPTATAASRLHVTTLAGSGSAGSTDATGTAASFNKPQGVVVSSTGDTYVADFGSNKIRKITPAGVVTTFAGSGTAASVDGTGTGASFNQPVGLALDTAGNLYVTDFGSNSIRKITPAGVVTTLAGSGTAGSTDGTGTGASFNQPGYITVDPNGTLYVSDYGSGRIRRVTPGGVVTTIATGLNGPVGIGIDPTGNLVVAEFGANRVRNVTLAGAVSTLAGSGTAGSADDTGTAASFNGPHGVSVDKAGYVYVTDRTTNRIRLITPGGVVTTIAGTGTAGTADGPTSIATLNGPGSVTLDASNNLVTGDWTGNKIRRITAAGSGSLAVAWTAPASTGGSAITDYLVEYRISPSGAWTTFNDGVSTTTTATITGLTDGTAYDVRVSAVNAAGTGTASTAATATPGAAPAAPTGLTLTAGAGQLTASWTAPAATGGSPITDYVVEYRTSPSGTWTTFADGVSTATTATITGLTNGTAYDVRISAANSLGAGTASATATATPDAAPAAPTGLTATASTTTTGALDLTWTAPASNGGSAITDYAIEYRTSPSGTWTTFADGTSTATTATITGLAGATAHDVRVSAVNAAGTGTASANATATAPRAWTPADLASAATWWLDATTSVATSGTAVTSWTSRAGTGVLTVPSGSTAPALATNSINGLATVRFTNDILSGADLFGGSSTNFNAVAVMRENTASGNWFLSFNGADTGTTRFSLHAPWTDRTWYDDAGGYTTNRATISGAPTAVGATTLVTLWKDQTAGNNGLRLNGGAFSATSSGSTAATTTGGLRIGTNTVDHDLAELLAFNRRLTTTEQNLVEGYLAWRWGTQALLPAGHPYKTNPPLTTTPLSAPGAPTGAAAIAGDTQTAVSWTAPASDGGSAVTGYTATATASGQTTRTCTATAPTTSCTITGLVNGITYAVSVTATNAVGTGSASTATSVIPYPTGVMSGATFALWLDAADASTITQSAGAVSQWNDKSGNGRHVTQATTAAQPAYGATAWNASRPALSFDGATTYLSGGDTLDLGTNSLTVLSVARPSTAGAPGTILSKSRYAAGAGRWALMSLTNGQCTSPAQAGMLYASASALASTADTATAKIYAGAIDRSGGLVSAFANGARAASTSYTPDAATNLDTTDLLLVGAYPNSSGTVPPQSGCLFNGTIAEIVVLRTALTDSARRQIDEYLARKWALTIVPGLPTTPIATAGGAQASVSWTAPAWDGGSAVTGYTATATASGQTTRTCTATAPATSCTITGLTSGVTYWVSVSATNAVGTGSSSATTTVTPT